MNCKLFCLIAISALAFPACLCGPTKVSLDRSRRFGNPKRSVRIDQVPVHGFDVEVTVRTDKRALQVAEGELLAVGENHIWIQTQTSRRKIHRSRITKLLVLNTFPQETWPWSGLTLAGAVFCVTHGWVAILSVPIWLATGLSTTGTAAWSNDMIVDPAHVDTLYQFARYPQGMARKEEKKPKKDPQPVAKPKAIVAEKQKPPDPVKPPVPPQEDNTGPVSGAMLIEGARYLWGRGESSTTWQEADKNAIKVLATLILPYLAPDLDVPAVDVVQAGATIVDRWVDPQTRIHHSVATLPLSRCQLAPDASNRLWQKQHQRQRGSGME